MSTQLTAHIAAAPPLPSSGQAQAPKAELPCQLRQWHDWAYQQRQRGLLTQHQVSLCAGPSAHIYDRAIVGEAEFTCMRLEESKLAKDSIILTRIYGPLWAGRVTAFLSHSPPGHPTGRSTKEEPDIAHVQWY